MRKLIQRVIDKNLFRLVYGQGNPRVVGAGSLREAGEEGTGGGISKVGGSWENWEKFRNIGTTFRNRKSRQRL